MDPLVYTNDLCKGCNRCISACPVLTANRSVGSGEAQRIEVHGENCIQCGACVEVCEHNAREFRDDTERFFADLRRGEPISLLLAPAFQANYPSEYAKVLGGLKRLGVKRIISISFGADITTWAYINYITRYNFTGGISQPCPAIVNYIEHYVPELIPKLVPIHSPMMCGAIYAKKYMGITDKLAFISPCIAKKAEICDPNTGGLITYNVTFDHLMDRVRRDHISGPDAADEIEYGLGSIYPMPGGLKENVYWFCGEEVFIRQVEGKKHAYEFLEDYRNRVKSGKPLPFMVDALNCDKGCLYGTGIEPEKQSSEDTFYTLQQIKEQSKRSRRGHPFSRKLSPAQRLKMLDRRFSKLKLEDFVRKYTDKSRAVSILEPNEGELEKIFESMNKHTREERTVNCGACGYSNCTEMAQAIFNRCNTPNNCIHFIRSEIQTFSGQLEESNRRVLEKNREMATFISGDFDSLGRSIGEMLRHNSINAEESAAISSAMLSITGFCDTLLESFQRIGALLEELERSTEEITDISDETNLLSVNASIEAARAGQGGKSFAIVAQQIKGLAASSKSLANGCHENRVDIVSAIAEIRDAATDLTDKVAEVNGRLERLAASTQEVASEANTVRDVSENVRRRLEELNCGDEA